MAIGYTPQTWVNGSAPALSAANLQTMDNGINAACDALDAMAVDGTGIPDATTAIKGRVALATTGVEEATKVPKATGADLAALLTAGGYTLTAPSGANSLDGIADTATWKKVAAAVATALNAGTYDAAKCTAFGIGGVTKYMTTADSMDNVFGIESGIFYSSSITDAPTAGEWTYFVMAQNANIKAVIAILGNAGPSADIRINVKYFTWQGWKSIWNASSDGNGGQQPAPKPNTTGNTTPGFWDAISGSVGSALSLPNTSSYKYAWFLDVFDNATGTIYDHAAGVNLGGVQIYPAVSGKIARGFYYEVI